MVMINNNYENDANDKYGGDNTTNDNVIIVTII